MDRIEAFLWISGIADTENLLLSLSFFQLVHFRALFVLPQNRSRRLTTEGRIGSIPLKNSKDKKRAKHPVFLRLE